MAGLDRHVLGFLMGCAQVIRTDTGSDNDTGPAVCDHGDLSGRKCSAYDGAENISRMYDGALKVFVRPHLIMTSPGKRRQSDTPGQIGRKCLH